MNVIDFYKRELQRIAWRLQYKARVKRQREIQYIEEVIYPSMRGEIEIDNRILIDQLLEDLPSDINRKIIQEIFINDMTESQLAKELNMTQQAVNKCKKRTLYLLYQKLSS